MKWNSIEINVELNVGKNDFTVYTCDFTKEYININTDYRSQLLIYNKLINYD